MAAGLAELSRLLSARRYDEVLRHCELALGTNGALPQFFQLRARALEGLRRWSDYANAVFEGARAYPQDVELGLRAAQLRIGQKEHAKAQSIIEQLSEGVLTTPIGALLYAQCFWGQGRYDCAMKFFRQAVDLNPADSRAQLALVRALLSLGERASALQQLSAFRSQDKEDPNAMFMAALAQVGLTDPSELRAAFDEVLARAPGHQLARCGAYLAGALGKTSSSLAPAEFPRGPLEEAQKDAIDTLVPEANVVPFPTDVLLRALAKAPSTGLILEFGVFHGRSLNLLASHTDRPIFGFDSFAGLPESWGEEPAGAYSTMGRMPKVPDHVTLIDGWFDEALPSFVAKHGEERLAFVHIDCDLYSSTASVLTNLAPQIQPGTVFVFDDYLGIPNARDHEYRAWIEFTEAHEVAFQYLDFTALGREVSLIVTNKH